MVRVLCGRIRYSLIIFLSPPQCSVFGAIQAGNVFAYAPDISSAKGASTDVVDLIDSRPVIDAESTGGMQVLSDRVLGKIRLENVHFRYPTRPGVRVLNGLSLEVQPGTYIALVGASGSGKSTV
jgi:ATP-binding cassette subfamily B (MDR/TAP) protein 1